MRVDLLGLELSDARRILQGEGEEPAVTRTGARSEGVWRVVYASDDGKRLTVAAFVEPLKQKA